MNGFWPRTIETIKFLKKLKRRYDLMFFNTDIYKNPKFDLNGDGTIDFYEYTKALETIKENNENKEDN